MANRQRRMSGLSGELARHSTFSVDGLELMAAMSEMLEVSKVKQASHSGRGSRIRRIVIQKDVSSMLVTIGCNDGHMSFRVFSSLSAAVLALRLESIFSRYQVQVRI